MNDIYNYFTFSIFFGYKFKDFIKVLEESYMAAIKHGKVQKYTTKLDLTKYYNPIYENQMEDFVCWENESYPDIIFFASKQVDGLNSLCYMLRKKIQCAMLQCSLSNKASEHNPMYRFHYTNALGEERIIMAYKEDKWIFYQSGIPLSFENIELYRKHRIKDRLNNNIIKDYLLKLNIDISNIDKNVKKCVGFKRLEWGEMSSLFQQPIRENE